MSTISSSASRIHSLDLIRGIAVLGILLMNITSFSQIGMAYLNPLLGVGIEGLNGTLWNINWLFADMKFMSIFSILFGAGVLLFTRNVERRGRPAAGLHYKRMLLLMGFGLAHAYLIWPGDILLAYSICGMVLFLLRKRSVRTLWWVAAGVFSVPILFSLLTYFGPSEAELQGIYSFWSPSQQEMDAETAAYLGSYVDQLPVRIADAISLQTLVFVLDTFWRALALMILGMILFRKGVLSAERSLRFYGRMAAFGLVTGLIVSGIGLYLAYSHSWQGTYVMGIGTKFNYVSSVAMALGYIGLILLIFKKGMFARAQVRLQAVGRMAFTNYILMSVMGMFVFYGNGLGYFGQVDRLGMLLISVGMWLLMLVISPIVLKKFGQGPLEKLWRTLTYLGSK